MRKSVWGNFSDKVSFIEKTLWIFGLEEGAKVQREEGKRLSKSDRQRECCKREWINESGAKNLSVQA